LAHLDTAKVRHLFDFIAGFDSGYGAKPAPQPLLAFAAAMGLAPEQVVMVGDSTHDLIAGRAAGMKTIAVLTGMAGPADLAPLADAVLPDIGHIPGWLQAQGWG
jgi:phosphoglycolate phosphatase